MVSLVWWLAGSALGKNRSSDWSSRLSKASHQLLWRESARVSDQPIYYFDFVTKSEQGVSDQPIYYFDFVTKSEQGYLNFALPIYRR